MSALPPAREEDRGAHGGPAATPSPRPAAKRIAHASMILLALLIVAWHAGLAPPARVPAWLAIALHLAALVPGLVLLARRRRSAAFWGALAALLLFCHGVMEAWTAPAVRALALAEVALCVAIIAGASLDGLRARFARKRAAV
jgi:uncharacterized membrane protein